MGAMILPSASPVKTSTALWTPARSTSSMGRFPWASRRQATNPGTKTSLARTTCASPRTPMEASLRASERLSSVSSRSRLRALTPIGNHQQQIIHIDIAIAVYVGWAWGRRVGALTPRAYHREQVVDIHDSVAVHIALDQLTTDPLRNA